MIADRLTLLDLPWLPRLPPEFKAKLASIQNIVEGDWGSPLQALAQHALGLNQAMAISRAAKQLSARQPSNRLSTFRLAVLSNGTLDFVIPFLEASALRYGIFLEVVTGPFGQPVQAALDPTSYINAAKPDAVLVALDHRGLPFRQDASGEWPPYRADAAVSELDAIRQGIHRHSGATCLLQSVPVPLAPLFGSLDATLSGSSRAAIAEFNRALAGSVASSGDVLIDIDYLAQSIGLDNWHDDRDWNMARLPFSRRALPLYADFVLRTIAAIRGKARKCLVLDLDNTVWGGVIGDDGLDGIAIDQGDPRGEAHRSVQMAALDLRRRGVVLAVCSKNEDAIARSPFREHPSMLLKETDIAVFMANWDDKATNLERIAQRLEIGLDALVLLDDNPAERAQVRDALPMVAVPEVGDDASTYARTLLMAGYFESVAFTSEDLARADQYRGNAERAELLEGSRDLGQFLQSLDMKIRFAPFQAAGRKRVTQLINKTNQFNLTTRRYTEAQVAEMETSPAHYTLQVGLTDRFGDNGMICAIICKCQGDAWEIDTWLMSCRVLNRRVEHAVCNRIARDAIRAGAKRLVGVFRPTPRNDLAAKLFEQLGFGRVASPDDEQRWLLALDNYQPFDIPMLEVS